MKEVRTLTWEFGLRKSLTVTLEDNRLSGAILRQASTSEGVKEINLSTLELLSLESAIKEVKEL